MFVRTVPFFLIRTAIISCILEFLFLFLSFAYYVGIKECCVRTEDVRDMMMGVPYRQGHNVRYHIVSSYIFSIKFCMNILTVKTALYSRL